MTHRIDRFAVGDRVRWYHNNDLSQISYMEKRFGNGPFEIAEVIEIPEHHDPRFACMYEQSPRESVGHVQQVVLRGFEEDPDGVFDKNAVSGAWLRKIDDSPIEYSDGSIVTWEDR